MNEIERMKVHAMLKAELERLKKLKKENAGFDTFKEKVEYLDREHIDQVDHVEHHIRGCF